MELPLFRRAAAYLFVSMLALACTSPGDVEESAVDAGALESDASTDVGPLGSIDLPVATGETE